MEEGWEERAARPRLSAGEVAARLRTYAGTRPVSDGSVLPGGLVNLNLLVHLGNPREDVILRVYVRDALAAAKEAAVLGLLEDEIPVPRVLDAATKLRPPHLLLSFVPGLPLETLLREGRDDAHARAGRQLGEALAHIHRHTYDDMGLLDGDLEVPEPMGGIAETLRGFLQSTLFGGRAGERLGESLRQRLWQHAEQHAGRLAEIEGRYCLQHADFKPTNVRVAADGRLTGLIDWEFVWAGPPLADLGQMFRHPLPQAYADALLRAYTEAGGELPKDWRLLAGLLDLFNLITFLDAPEERPTVFRDVRGLIEASVSPKAKQ